MFSPFLNTRALLLSHPWPLLSSHSHQIEARTWTEANIDMVMAIPPNAIVSTNALHRTFQTELFVKEQETLWYYRHLAAVLFTESLHAIVSTVAPENRVVAEMLVCFVDDHPIEELVKGSLCREISARVSKHASLQHMMWRLFASSAADGRSAVANLTRETGIDLTQCDEEGRMPLMQFVASGSEERLLRAVIETGVDLEARDRSGETALMLAVRKHADSVVKMLLEAGASVDSRRSDGRSVLHVCGMSGTSDLAQLLCENFANKEALDHTRATPLLAASEAGNTSLVRALIKCGCNIDHRDSEGRTALHIATRKQHLEVVRALLMSGASASTRGSSGESPLLAACKVGNAAITKLLCQHGIKAKGDIDDTGRSAAMLAAVCGSSACLSVLVDFGSVDLNERFPSGDSLLLKYSSEGNEDAVRALLSAGCDVKALNTHFKRSALHNASLTGHLPVVEMLLEAVHPSEHAEWLNARDRVCRTPLLCAAENSHGSVVQYLLKKGSDLEAVDDRGWNVLFWAARNDDIQTMRYLMKHHHSFVGKGMLKTDSRGQTLHTIASENQAHLALSLLFATESSLHLDQTLTAPLLRSTSQTSAISDGTDDQSLTGSRSPSVPHGMVSVSSPSPDASYPLSPQQLPSHGHGSSCSLSRSSLSRGVDEEVPDLFGSNPRRSWAGGSEIRLAKLSLRSSDDSEQLNAEGDSNGEEEENEEDELMETNPLHRTPSGKKDEKKKCEPEREEVTPSLSSSQPSHSTTTTTTTTTTNTSVPNTITSVKKDIGSNKGKFTPSPSPPTRQGVPTGLMMACAMGDLRCVEDALGQGTSVEAEGYIPRLLPEMLIDFHHDVRDLSFTPILMASYQGHSHVVRFLAEKGANLEARCDHRRTCLLVAAQNGHVEVVHTLIDWWREMEKGVDQTGVSSKENNNQESGRRPLSLSLSQLLEEVDVWGRTPLLWAAYNGHTACVDALVSEGANLSAVCSSLRTPLLWACYMNRVATVETILSLLKGDKMGIHAVDAKQRTALMLAVSNDSVPVARLLIEAGCNPSVSDGKRRCVLHTCARERSSNCLRYLLSVPHVLEALGGSVDVLDVKGKTPLMVAASRGAISVMQLLVSAGASLNRVSKAGHTVLSSALEATDRLAVSEVAVRLGASLTSPPAAADDKDLKNEQSAIEVSHDNDGIGVDSVSVDGVTSFSLVVSKIGEDAARRLWELQESIREAENK